MPARRNRGATIRRDSGADLQSDLTFCPECGSTVFWKLDLFPDRIGMAAGAFADPAFPAPHVAVWTEHKYRWVPLPEGVPDRPKQI